MLTSARFCHKSTLAKTYIRLHRHVLNKSQRRLLIALALLITRAHLLLLLLFLPLLGLLLLAPYARLLLLRPNLISFLPLPFLFVTQASPSNYLTTFFPHHQMLTLFKAVLVARLVASLAILRVRNLLPHLLHLAILLMMIRKSYFSRVMRTRSIAMKAPR